MLLAVSFFHIATTLPVTICYSLYYSFPPGRFNLTEAQIDADPAWQRHLAYYGTKVSEHQEIVGIARLSRAKDRDLRIGRLRSNRILNGIRRTYRLGLTDNHCFIASIAFIILPMYYGRFSV